MLQKLIFSLTVLLFTSNLFGQLYEVSLQEKTRDASFIIEGEVTKSKSYVGNDNEIYTANEIVVYKKFKGNDVPERLTVITLGGTVDNETTSWTHLLNLSVGDAGIFFLEDTKRPLPDNLDIAPKFYNVYASSQGFLKYSFEDDLVKAHAPFWYSENIKNDIYDLFRQEIEIPTIYFTPDWEQDNQCIVFKFDVGGGQTPQSALELESLVSVKSTIGEFYLQSAAIIAKYNSTVLGQDVIQSGALQAINYGISASNDYSINSTDLSSNEVELKIDFTSTIPLDMTLVDSSFQPLVKLKLTLQTLADPNIVIDADKMQQNTKYYNTTSQKPEQFRCIDVVGDFDVKLNLACSPPVITSFTTSFLPPDTVRAGTFDTLTIRGMCFDSIRGISEVEFTDADTGPVPVMWVTPLDGDYVLWSDTLIKVIVPSWTKTSLKNSAGTGKFRVNRGAFGIATSATDLYIPFAALNHATGALNNPANKSLKLYVPNRNGMGGQSIYYAANFVVDTNAVKTFERALEKWRCTTFINYKIQDSIAVPNIFHAGRIEYDSLHVGVMSTTLASTGNPSFFCAPDSAGLFIGSERRRFTIKFNSNLNWHKDTLMPIPLPANTYDLESRAVHELGHGHLLNHSNNVNDLMYFTDAVAPFEYRREILDNDENGGIYIVQISSNSPPTCPPAMVPLTLANCSGTTNVVELENKELIFVQVFPNPTSDKLNIFIDYQKAFSKIELKAYLFDLLGNEILSKPINSNNTKIDVSSLPSGIYLFSIAQKGNFVQSFKIIKN